MRVALFTTCLAEALAPRALKATVLVLEHCGVTVELPTAQTCCGQPMLSNGLPGDAALLARRMTEVFAPYDAVVTPSGSCCSVVREKYAGLFADGSRDRAAVDALAAKTFELIEFLETKLGIDPATLRAKSSPRASTAPLTCHDACHLRGIHRHGCTEPFLRSACGGDVRELPDMTQCCGFGGMFSTQFPEVSTALGEEKLAHVASTGATTLVASDTGCAAHLAGLAHRKGVALRVISPAEALAESLGLMEVQESGAPNGGKHGAPNGEKHGAPNGGKA